MDPEWVKDNEATHCCICGVEFGYVLARRHHCRTCGRVICSKCRNFHEINSTPISVCLNCLKTRAIQEAIGTQTASIAHGRERSDTNAGKGGNFGDSNSLPPNIAKLDSSMFDDQNDGKAAFWKLPSAEEDAHEVIGEFFYTNAPSFCLFESIVALHFNVDEVVNFLFSEVKTISEYFNIQKKRDPSESASANNTANMGVMFLMQNLMGMAQSKIQRGNSTKSATAEIETIAEPYNFYNFKISPSVDQINELEKEFDKLSLGIEALQLLLRIEYDSIPNLATIMDSKTHNENVIMQLMKQGKYTEALEFCQKCDLDAKQVYKRWGLSALKTGALDEARAFFKKCLDSSRSLKNEDLVKEIIETMETNVMNPTPSTFKSFEDFWVKMEDELKSEIPLLTNNLQRLEECAFYVETYLPCRNLVSFYADRGEMKRALDVFTDSSNLITAEDFNKNLFKVAVQLGEKDGGGSHIEELLRQIQESNTDKAFWRKFLLPIASNSDTYKPEIMVHLHLALEDYVRAGEDWCRIYDGVIVESYKQLYEKHSHLLAEADQCFDHASQNLQSPGSKLEGNKYLTSTELNCLKGKVDLQRQVAEFLSNSNVDHFPEVAKKTTQSSSGHLTGQEASKKGMPTLLGREDQSVRVVAALLAEYQSGTGFNLATDAIKFLHLNLDEVGVMVARELQAGDRFRSILYLASSFSGSRDPALSGYTDRFLSTCVEVYVDRHGEPAPGPQLNRLKELVEKIKNIDARISCFIAMGDLQQAQLQIVKKDRNGIDDMLKIIDLAESGKYKGMVNLDQFITMCRMWLRKFDKTEETTES